LVRQVPWPFKTQGDFKWNLARDLKWNDRLYVASAGNDMAGKLLYPAAHDLVLGVTGVEYNPFGRTLQERYGKQTRSNYMPDQTYPVSGIFDIVYDYSTTAVTPLDHPAYNPGTFSHEYLWFNGTSAAAPQVAALAYHLYSRRPNLSGANSTNRQEVEGQIVSTRLTEIEPYLLPWRAPASFRRAIDNW
jgi:subtilisin family serine protease